MSNVDEVAVEGADLSTDAAVDEATTELAIRILKVETCPSLSGRSQLTYHIGCSAEGEVFLRLYNNTAKGYFSREWVPMHVLETLIGDASETRPITSGSLQTLFKGKSVNSAGFVLSVLKHEGLVQATESRIRSYAVGDLAGFRTAVQALVQSDIALSGKTLQAPKQAPTPKGRAKGKGEKGGAFPKAGRGKKAGKAAPDVEPATQADGTS